MKKTLLLLTLLVFLSTTNGQEQYLNKDFGFEAVIPKEWSVYKETPAPTSNYMIIAWGMPKFIFRNGKGGNRKLRIYYLYKIT